jgi:superfamily II DNA/RNA helicase
MIKLRMMRWAGHVARMGEKGNAYRILVGSQKERYHWEDQGVGGWTILKWMGWYGLD